MAGLGTRFLPATKASPKEMLPVVDKPLIQYAVEEAVAAGVTELIFVTGRGKRAIEDHFDQAVELELALEKNGRIAVSPDPANRRRKWLSLTPEGEALYRTLRPEGERVAAFLFSGLSEEEMARFAAMVDRLIVTLEATDEAGRSLFLERTKPAKGAAAEQQRDSE